MGSSPLSLLLLFLLTLPTSNATLHRAKLLTSEFSAGRRPSSPTTYFEVTRPIPLPKTKPCSTLVLQHDFGDTYSKPPVTALYKPPSHCPLHRPPSAVVLEWSAACRGRQFDRIFGVWLGGVELLRSCTAEPRATGIVWTVKKDVTRYSSLFAQPHTLAVYLGNLIDQTYTGIYHVNVSLHFFFDSSTHRRPRPWPVQPSLLAPPPLSTPPRLRLRRPHGTSTSHVLRAATSPRRLAGLHAPPPSLNRPDTPLASAPHGLQTLTSLRPSCPAPPVLTSQGPSGPHIPPPPFFSRPTGPSPSPSSPPPSHGPRAQAQVAPPFSWATGPSPSPPLFSRSTGHRPCGPGP